MHVCVFRFAVECIVNFSQLSNSFAIMSQRSEPESVTIKMPPDFPERPCFNDVPSNLGPQMTLPFQFVLAHWHGQRIWNSLDISTAPVIAALTAPYRYAELTSLEVVFFPTAFINAHEEACYAEIRFVTADIQPAQTDMLDHPGAYALTFGAHDCSNRIVACPLQAFNPIIKSPFAPLDRIRLALLVPQCSQEDPYPQALVNIVIRGSVKVAYPAFN